MYYQSYGLKNVWEIDGKGYKRNDNLIEIDGKGYKRNDNLIGGIHGA